jgi:hypothetical protein
MGKGEKYFGGMIAAKVLPLLNIVALATIAWGCSQNTQRNCTNESGTAIIATSIEDFPG